MKLQVLDCYKRKMVPATRFETRDPLITNQVLYQLSYAGAEVIYILSGYDVKSLC